MPMPDPSNETNALVLLGAKILGYAGSFVAGIVAATWAVATKLKGYDDRLKSVEEAQSKCQGVTLVKLDEKLDYIIQEGFPDVHKRIDAVLLKEK